MNGRVGHSLPRISVAVLSHKRPHLLARVLWAVAQQDYPEFEVIVVGDQPDISGFRLPDHFADQIKYVHCPDANICRSRNLAVQIAAGEVIAFCDDDAVPEPDWLRQLARAFVFQDVGGVGGLVRGSDGIKIEWRGGTFDRTGAETFIPMRDEVRVFDADSQVYGNQFVGTMGANSAFRREAVLSVGGFDESYRYYLDETDLMLRLAEAGWDSALVLTAEVHHIREENSTRDGLRTPRDLFEIAASKAYFCRRHMQEGGVEAVLRTFLEDRLDELDPYIRAGLLRQRDRKRLRTQIERGIAAGLSRVRCLPMNEDAATAPFLAFKPLVALPVSVALVSGWNPVLRREMTAAARLLADQGMRVSHVSFMSGWRGRAVRFRQGIWNHTGGTWRLDHVMQGKRLLRRADRARAELERVDARRQFDIVLSPRPLLEGDAREVRLPGLSKPVFASRLRRNGARWETALDALTRGLDPRSAHAPPGDPAPSRPHGGRNPATDASTIPG